MNFNNIKDIIIADKQVKELYINNKRAWTRKTGEIYAVCFEAQEADSKVGIIQYSSAAPFVYLEYSKNGRYWTEITSSTELQSVTLLNIGDKVYFRAQECGNFNFANATDQYNYFVMTGKIKASGNIMSLLDKNNKDLKTLTEPYTFDNLFNNCSSLIQAPELPATELCSNCYKYMFQDCTSLTQAPELPATTLADNCYSGMFEKCTSLTQAPELPATTLADNCYISMFMNCTSLTQAPELPANNLIRSCYCSMFNSCSSLTQAPELPATTLADYCYNCMFYGCTSLTLAPELPATTLKGYCYGGMFDNCTSLKEVRTKQSDFTGCVKWLPNKNGVDFYCTPTLKTIIDTHTSGGTRGTSNVPIGYNIISEGRNDNYVCFEKVGTTGERVTLIDIYKSSEDAPTVKLEYTKNPLGNWTQITSSTTVKIIQIEDNEKLYIRAQDCGNDTLANEYGWNHIKIHGDFKASGNIMSLLDKNNKYLKKLTKDYTFKNLLSGNIGLITAPELPATELCSNCYKYMFKDCTSLTQAPELPATTLTEGCYESMFNGCTSLKTPPELPATKIMWNSYDSMFANCTSLTSTPIFKTGTIAYESGLRCMFLSCTSLTSANNIPDNPSGISCYFQMFKWCSALENPPNIPSYMEQGTHSNFEDMFAYCTSLKTPPELPATTLNENCYNGMFQQCTSLTSSPMLPAETLIEDCYANMFACCTSLKEVRTMQSDFTGCRNWLQGVPQLTSCNFYCKQSLNVSSRSDNTVPLRWTINKKY